MRADLRAPRFSVLLNKQVLPNVTFLSTSDIDGFGATRFCLEIAGSGVDIQGWGDAPWLIECLVSLSDEPVSLVAGYVDEMIFDHTTARIELQGRDLTALFLSALTCKTFENQSVAEIATSIATHYGLTANIDATTGLFGRFFSGTTNAAVFAQYAKFQSDWDILCAIARDADCLVWVDGWSLNIAPSGISNQIFALTCEDCTAVSCRKQLDLSTGISVTVKSRNIAVEQTVLSTAQTGSGGVLSRQVDLVVPNVTQSRATEVAQYLLAQLSMHIRSVILEMPGELLLTPRSSFALNGTNSEFDGLYDIRSIDRHISFERGFTQTVTGYQKAWTPS